MAVLEYNKKRYPLIEKIIIGRQKSCDIALLDQGASREHCKIFHDNKNRIWVEDLGSANGTKLNGDTIKAPCKLKDGDSITCSKSEIKVHLDEADREQNRSSLDMFNPEALVGTLISGHRVQSVIGSTNIVTVYIARQLSLDRDVVLKVVHPNFADAESPLAREIDEQTKAAARINHQSIAQVHECGTENNFIWSSMELIDGEMLFDLLDREGQLAPEIALMMAEKIADGMQSAHEHDIVHRALNPRNIMLSKDGRIKVVDLVLEQFLRYHLEQKGIPTPEDHADYLAPELLRGKKGDAKSDIYGLGCILFQMLTGQPPYVFDSAAKTAQAHIKDPIPDITEHCPDLPTSIKECVSTMLHKNAEWRHQSMGDLREELEKIRKELPSNIGQQKARKVTNDAGMANGNAGDRPSQRLSAAKGGRGMAVVINLLIFAALGLFVWYMMNKLDPNEFTKDYVPPVKTPTTNDDPNNLTPGTDLSGLNEQAQKNMAQREVQQANKALDDLWQRTKTKIEQETNQNEWDSAEYKLRRALPQFKNSTRVTNTANNYLKQLLISGRTWYNGELQKINSGNSIDELRQQCIDLNSLRSKVLNESRPDVEARYQQAVTGMQRHLARAKQSAISQIENGELKALQAESDALKKSFAGTAIEQMHSQFSALVHEAQRIDYLGDWSSTREQLVKADSAEERLSAGAALILSGNTDAGTKLLLDSAKFNNKSLQKRRDALLRSQAAILKFDDSSDLQQLNFTLGQPELGNGYLSGVADNLYEFEARNTLGNQQWEVSCALEFPQGLSNDSEVVLQIGSDGEAPIVVRINKSQIIARIESSDQEQETPSSFNPRQVNTISIIYSNGSSSVLVNNTILSQANVTLSADSQLNFTSTSSHWKLNQLQVVGGN